MITLERAQQHLQAWLDAELKVSLKGQSYTLGSRTLTYANLPEIRKQIEFWNSKVAVCKIQESGKTVRRAKRFVPRDL
jgi:hypothetical protein